MSPQELLIAAQVQVPALGLATVYRNLKALAEAGEVELVSLPGQAPRYESAATATTITSSANPATGSSRCTAAPAAWPIWRPRASSCPAMS